MPGGYVSLLVSDSGHDMDPETLRKASEPLFTTKAVEKGTGLGLSIVHRSVEQHGGAVRVYSAVGRRTTFRVFLPRVEMKPGAISFTPRPIPLPFQSARSAYWSWMTRN